MPKETLAEWMERGRTRAVQRLLKDSDVIRRFAGDRPPFSVKLDHQEQAARALPDWLVMGQAEPQVSARWWAEKAAERGASYEGMAWKDMYQADRHYRRLYNNAKTSLQATLGMTPELVQQFATYQALGLHSGTQSRTAKDTEGGSDGP